MSRKFTSGDINAAVAKLPKATQKLIPKQTKSQDIASIFGMIGNAVNSKTGIIVLNLLLSMGTAVKDGGKISKKKRPARKAKIAKVMKRKK